MPEIVEDIDFTDPPNHSPYPWDQWADGLTRRFTMGVDFHTTTRDFARQARRAAWKRNMRATIRRDEDDVIIRFGPKDLTAPRTEPTT